MRIKYYVSGNDYYSCLAYTVVVDLDLVLVVNMRSLARRFCLFSLQRLDSCVVSCCFCLLIDVAVHNINIQCNVVQ